MTVITRLLLALALPAALAAQVPADLARERAEFAAWLTSARSSPYAAVAHAPLGRGLVLGPADADVPLPGIGRARITEEDGVVRLTSSAGTSPIPRYREVTLGAYRVVVGGEPGRLTVTVFGALRDPRPPAYYPYSAAAVFVGALTPPAQARRQRMLALDGIEVEATHAGTFPVRFGRNETRLTVLLIPETGTEESELMIYFRDSTNAQGTYPAGRFVPLVPLGDGRYRLDFNRARNPFCAYSTVYACPLPWPGNTIPARVEAGERYAPHD